MSHWNHKVIVVTGGSEGLGKAIVEAFAQQAATVVMLARDEQKLLATQNELAGRNLQVHSIVADVTNDNAVQAAVTRIVSEHGSINVWVNNVGKSSRASVLKCGAEEYNQLMQLNFLSAVRCTSAVLSDLTRSAGSLVNIGSLASKTAWPMMAPYAASKHALAAYTHQLRLEGPANVNFLHVCPGPIRRPDAGHRYDATAADISATARRAGAGAKLRGIEPFDLAQRIVKACEQRKRELIIPSHARILFAIAQLSPAAGDWLLKRFMSRD